MTIEPSESGLDPTEDEISALEEAQFEVGKGFHDYGNGDLLVALRKGYELGRRDGEFEWSVE